MLKNLKITTKLLVIVALLTIIAVLTIGYVGIHMAKKSTINTQITMLEHIADLKADKIESFFNERRADIKIAQDYFNIKTNLPIVTQFAADRTNPAYITAKKMLNSQAKTFTDANECYVDFMLLNPKGKVMYSANELHEKKVLDNPLTDPEGEKAFEQGKKGVYFSDIYVSEFEDYVYGWLITAPALNFNGQFIGVIALELCMDPIYKFLQYTTGLGETGEILIGKKVEDGALFVNPLRHDKDAALKRQAIFGEKSAFPIQEAVQGRNGSGLSIDYRGKEIVAAWRNIPALDWGLVAKIDLTETFATVNKLKKIVLYIACFIIAIALIGAFTLSISITSPLKKLSDTILKISKGDLKQRVEIKSRDEIGQLADSFNMMTGKLMVSRDELINAKDYIDNIIKTMADTLIVVSPDATIKTVNQATLNLLGYKEDELIEKPISMIIAEEEEEEEELFKRSGIEDLIKKGFISSVEKTYLSKDGIKIPILFSGSVMRDDQGKVQGIVCAASDITERKQLEEERQTLQLKMMQTSKLASLGEIATGIAHEINQPLTYINSFVHRLRAKLEDDIINKDELIEDAETSSSQIDRIDNIIEHLRTFGRRDDMVKEQVDIETILNNTLLLMGERIRLRNIELKKNIESNLPMISGSPTQLEQVFINLFQNSIGAFPGKYKDAEIRVDISLSKDKASVVIKFADNGMGIEKENVDRIFEPFFTTKEVGKGIGLGLSIVYGIIREHNGTIACESEVNRGSIFTVALPVK